MDELDLKINKEFEPYLASSYVLSDKYEDTPYHTRRYKFRFPNHRGALVIKTTSDDPAFGNCGGPKYWELLVLDWRYDEPEPDYYNDITDDVVCGDDEAINGYLKRIKDMPPIG